MKQCPSSKIVMSGYSQGGQLVHNAAKLLPASTVAAVSSVVIFGDPCKSIQRAFYSSIPLITLIFWFSMSLILINNMHD